jgi:hypothetical protein
MKETFLNKFLEYSPVFLIDIAILFYFLTLTFGYFIPIITNNTIGVSYWISDLNLENYSFTFILLEFIFTLINLTLLTISFYFTRHIKNSTIPNSYPWKYESNYGTPQEKVESNALILLKIENELKNNNNKLYLKNEITENSHLLNNYIQICERDKNDNSIRICKTCKKLRPDRCHHCRKCNQCFLKFDHHCLWLNKCITFDNHKSFILLLFYTITSSISFCIIFIKCFYNIFLKEGIGIKLFSIYMFYCLTFGIMIPIIFLLFYHLSLVSKNLTSYEYIIKKGGKDKIFYYQYDGNINPDICTKKLESIYDVGVYDNFKQVFGLNYIEWFIPIKINHGDNGLYFQINENSFKIEEEPNEIIQSI